MNQKGNAKSDGCIRYPACLQLEQTTRFECTIPDHFAACLGITLQLKGSSSPFVPKTEFYDLPMSTVFCFLLEEGNSFTLGNSDL
jgi:hypothetical protein